MWCAHNFGYFNPCMYTHKTLLGNYNNTCMEPREALYNVMVDTIVHQDIKPYTYSIELFIATHIVTLTVRHQAL